MKKIFFTPGPSQLYPTVPKHITEGMQAYIGSISHRSTQFQEIYQELAQGLKSLLQIPEEYQIFIVGSGTEAMERTIQNCVEKYSLHFVNGSFAKRMFVIAQELGKKPEKIEVPIGEGFDFKKITIPKRTELICFTQNETSSGVMIPVSDIETIAKKILRCLSLLILFLPFRILIWITNCLMLYFFQYKKVLACRRGWGL